MEKMSNIFSVVLSDEKRVVIKHIGKSTTLEGARKIKSKRKIQPNQSIWIGEYDENGVLQNYYK